MKKTMPVMRTSNVVHLNEALLLEGVDCEQDKQILKTFIGKIENITVFGGICFTIYIYIYVEKGGAIWTGTIWPTALFSTKRSVDCKFE